MSAVQFAVGKYKAPVKKEFCEEDLSSEEEVVRPSPKKSPRKAAKGKAPTSKLKSELKYNPGKSEDVVQQDELTRYEEYSEEELVQCDNVDVYDGDDDNVETYR